MFVLTLLPGTPVGDWAVVDWEIVPEIATDCEAAPPDVAIPET